jgi:hypothetical protein
VRNLGPRELHPRGELGLCQPGAFPGSGEHGADIDFRLTQEVRPAVSSLRNGAIHNKPKALRIDRPFAAASGRMPDPDLRQTRGGDQPVAKSTARIV